MGPRGLGPNKQNKYSNYVVRTNLCCYAPELCETMRNYAELCGTMQNSAKLRGTTRNYAELHETTRNYAKLCETNVTNEKL